MPTDSELLNYARRVLGAKPPNEQTYVQHSPNNYRAARNALLEYGRRHVSGFAWPSNNDDVNIFGILGCWIDAGGPAELQPLWYRLMCIHPETFREHDQPAHVFSPPINCRGVYSSATPVGTHSPEPATEPTLHDQIVNGLSNTEQENDMETSEAANERLHRLANTLGEIGITPESIMELLRQSSTTPATAEPPATTRTRTVRLD